MAQPLPFEVCYVIIGLVGSKNDLCSLALCCLAFRDEAQRRLYDVVEPESLNRQNQFIASINGAPLRLGPLVRTFKINRNSFDDAVPLSEALEAMCALEHLNLRRWDPSAILPLGVFQLRTFICEYVLEAIEVQFMVSCFLASQQGLKRLEIHCDESSILEPPPMNPCPQLESFTTNSKGLTNIFVPKNQLISEFHCFIAPTLPVWTTRQLNHFKSLTFPLPRLGMYTYFVRHLSSLVDLEIIVTIVNLDRVSQILLLLEDIPHLEVLVLSLQDCISELPDNAYTSFSEEYRRAFEICSRLKQIDLIYKMVHNEFPKVLRQTRTEKPLQSTYVREWRYLM